MKNRLICQSSDYDCGPTSMTNAMRYLFERSEIPPVVLKRIWSMGLDAFSEGGELGKAGTSKAAMRYMAIWLEDFAEKCHFPIRAAFLDEEHAVLSKGGLVWNCVERGGCAVVRCSHNGNGHYVLLTTLLSDDVVGLFDPYDEDPDLKDPGRRFIYDEPKRMNRAVRVEYLNAEDDTNYAMGPLGKREILLLWRRPEE